MRTVAYIRSIELAQADPFLRGLDSRLGAQGARPLLFYTEQNDDTDLFPGEVVKVARTTTAEELARRIRRSGATQAVSLSIPDENAIRDAVVGELLAEDGIRTVVHPLEATMLFSNKWATKQYVTAFGVKSPPAVLADGDLLAGRGIGVPDYRRALQEVVKRKAGFPLLAKPLWDNLSNGIRYIGSADDLAEFFDEGQEVAFVLERCLVGELASIEVVGDGSRYRCQPLVWKGETGGEPRHVFQTVRHTAHRPDAHERLRELSASLLSMAEELRLRGTAEFEFIYHDGEFYLIEVNARVSGSSALSSVASGANIYHELSDIALGVWDCRSEPGGHRPLAVQIPVSDPVAVRRASLPPGVSVVRSGAFKVADTSFPNVLLRVDGGRIEAWSDSVEQLWSAGAIDEPTADQLRDIWAGAVPAVR